MFWLGLLNALNSKDIKNVFDIKHKPKPKEFMILLKNNNIKTIDVKWNGAILNDNILNENMKHIKNLQPKKINEGYLCSVCDPVLLLIVQLFNINIIHNYNGVIVKYTIDSATKEIELNNNSTHFF